MKSITINETQQISGGLLLSANGVTSYINTTGIPDRCVNQFSDISYELISLYQNPNLTDSMLKAAMLPHADRLIASGCIDYVQLFTTRLESAVIY